MHLFYDLFFLLVTGTQLLAAATVSKAVRRFLPAETDSGCFPGSLYSLEKLESSFSCVCVCWVALVWWVRSTPHGVKVTAGRRPKYEGLSNQSVCSDAKCLESVSWCLRPFRVQTGVGCLAWCFWRSSSSALLPSPHTPTVHVMATGTLVCNARSDGRFSAALQHCPKWDTSYWGLWMMARRTKSLKCVPSIVVCGSGFSRHCTIILSSWLKK